MQLPLLQYKDQLKYTREGNDLYVYDIIRKKSILILPEELVRQTLVHYLIDKMNYPSSRIQLEKGVRTNQRQGRYDIIIYDKAVNPWMIIECKSHRIKLTQNVFDQLDGYNATVNAPYYLVSNGIDTYCYRKNETGYIILDELPVY